MIKNTIIIWLGLFLLIAAPAAGSRHSMAAEEPASLPVHEETEYTYDPEGKTDPFEPFVVKKEEKVTQIANKGSRGELQETLSRLKDLKRPKTELQTIPLSSITLTSILHSGDSSMAMVKGPEDNKGYLLKKGTYIGTNGGVVDRIINEERMTDLGKQLIRKVVIKEPYLDADKKISYRRVELKMPGSLE